MKKKVYLVTTLLIVSLLVIACDDATNTILDAVDAGSNAGANAGPNVRVDAGPDIKVNAGPDVRGNAGPDIKVNAGPDIKANAGPDVRVNAGPDIKVNADPDIKVNAGPDIEVNAGPDEGFEESEQLISLVVFGAFILLGSGAIVLAKPLVLDAIHNLKTK